MNNHDNGSVTPLAGELPRGSALRSFLETYRNRKIFRPPLTNMHGKSVGNNGDQLMVLGADKFLQQYDVEIVESPEAADLILFGGNGGMHENYHTIPRIFSQLARTFPKTPIAMLPSTYFFPNSRMADIIGDREGFVKLFCRERYSYNHLLNHHQLPANCTIELDHDMAFHLGDEQWVSNLRNRVSKNVLIVERLDSEHVTAAFQRTWRNDVIGLVGKVMPQPLKRSLYPIAGRVLGSRQSPMRLKSMKLLEKNYPDLTNAPVVSMDISLQNFCTFDKFCTHIADAKVVFTTRLHVGILSSILGRPTLLFDGPYHKIRGIYEHSLASLPGVRLVEN